MSNSHLYFTHSLTQCLHAAHTQLPVVCPLLPDTVCTVSYCGFFFLYTFSLSGSLSVILLELRMMEVVVTTGAIRHANSSQIIITNKPTPSFLQSRCTSCRPTNSVTALKGNLYMCYSIYTYVANKRVISTIVKYIVVYLYDQLVCWFVCLFVMWVCMTLCTNRADSLTVL